jgi:hypothetical protein
VADADLAALVEVDGVLRHDEAGDAAIPVARLGARRGYEDLTDTRVSDEDLGAIDDVVVTLGDGGGRRSSASRPPPLCQQIHPSPFPEASSARSVSLLVGAELDDRRGAEVGGHRW